MNMKKVFLYSIIPATLLAVAAGVGYIYMSGSADEAMQRMIGIAGERAVAKVSVESVVPLTTTSQYQQVTGGYPQFTNTSVAFNNHIKQVVLDAQAAHEKDSTDNWQGRFATEAEGLSIPDAGSVTAGESGAQAIPKPDDRYQFNVEHTVVRNDERYVSFVLLYSGYTGGAHGYQIVATFTFDKSKKREITISDLYTPEQLTKLAAEIRPKLITQIAKASEQKESEVDAGWVSEGTDPAKPENFAAFTLPVKNSEPGEFVTFYFQQYQVVAYAFGMPEITVPYSVVQN
jgi:hypothetical protein